MELTIFVARLHYLSFPVLRKNRLRKSIFIHFYVFLENLQSPQITSTHWVYFTGLRKGNDGRKRWDRVGISKLEPLGYQTEGSTPADVEVPIC